MRFLLDRLPPFEEEPAGDHDGEKGSEPPVVDYVGTKYVQTPMAAGAASLAGLNFDFERPCQDMLAQVHDRVARGEEVMNLLLNRGASASTTTVAHWALLPVDTQSLETVIGLAVSRAGYKLVRRLLDNRADVNTRQRVYTNTYMTGFAERDFFARDITPLHLASSSWNAEGIRALLDYQYRTANDRERENELYDLELFTCRDSNGRIPLHWAAAGNCREDELLLSDAAVQHIVSTLKILVAGNPDTIKTWTLMAQHHYTTQSGAMKNAALRTPTRSPGSSAPTALTQALPTSMGAPCFIPSPCALRMAIPPLPPS